MAHIKAFQALRPPIEKAPSVSELPYDVCSSEEARIIAEKNSENFYHISKPEVDLPLGTDPYSDVVYNKGAENLRLFQEKGLLKLDDNDALFLYTLVMNGRSQTGLVALVAIDDYINDRVKKHEYTREAKENDRIRHMNTLGAQVGPVFLMVKQKEAIKKLFDDAMALEAELDFTAPDGVRHIVRKIAGSSLIDNFCKSFADETLYIADGHHRAASAVKIGQQRRDSGIVDSSDHFLTVIFPDEELFIMPYNRAVKDLNGLGKDELLAQIGVDFSIEKCTDPSPKDVASYCMYLDGEWYLLKPNFQIPNDPVESLDVQILQSRILSPILGIGDPRKDERIEFIGGIRGTEELEKLVNSGSFAVAFSMYPTTIAQLIEVSDSGNVMPPKSTWFEPKLRSGLFIHKFH